MPERGWSPCFRHIREGEQRVEKIGRTRVLVGRKKRVRKVELVRQFYLVVYRLELWAAE